MSEKLSLIFTSIASKPSQLQQRTEYDRGHEFGQFILLPDPENGKSKQSSKEPVRARVHRV